MTEVKAPEMAKTTKSELIFRDESKIFQIRQSMKEAEKALNEFYEKTTETLGELSLEQIKKLPTAGRQVVKKEMESRFDFPKASTEFNLDALGINPAPAYAAYKFKLWQKYNFVFKGGEFIPAPEDQQPEIMKHYHFANTPEKKHAVKLIRDMLKLKNEMMAAGLVGNGSDASLFKFMNYNVLTREKGIGRTPIIFNPSGCIQMLNAMDKK
jgi:hypothetical protein